MNLQVVLIGEDSVPFASLRQHLRVESSLLLENKVCPLELAYELLRAKSGPVLAVVDLSSDAEQAFQTSDQIKLRLANVHLVITSPDNNPEVILRAMRSGAEEFLTQPFRWPEVLQAVERIRERIDLRSRAVGEEGRIITILSSRGGVGATTVATNLAVTLANKRQKSVCVMDLVLQFGSVTNFLNIESPYTILDLIQNLKRIDSLLVDGSLARHSSGVRVLAEPFHPEDARAIEADDIEQILDTLAQSFNFLVIDTPKKFDDVVFMALDKSHLILFVTEMDVVSLKSAQRAFELFQRLRPDENKIRLVLNRYLKSKIMSVESVEKVLGREVFWALPNDYPTAISALNQGLAIAQAEPRSELARSYLGLTDKVIQNFSLPASRMAKEEERRRGLFDRVIPFLSKR